MSENLQKLLKDALLNNSYDYDAMHKTLKTTWLNSFSYLYALQNAYVEYEELFYFSNDEESRNSKHIGHLYLENLSTAAFDVDYDLIHVFSREEFRLSKYYLNQFTIDDMVYNPNIFLKIPIVIIDDHVIWDYKIRVTKDCTHFVLPFKRDFVLKNERNPETDDIIYQDHKIQVLVVDNVFYQRYTMNKSNLFFNLKNKTIQISKEKMYEMATNNLKNYITDIIMKKYNIKSILDLNDAQLQERQLLYNKKIKYINLPDQNGTMMCSLHMPNDKGKLFELGSALIPMHCDENGNYIASLTDDIVENINNQNIDLYISVWFMNQLYHHKFYDGEYESIATENGAKILVVERDEMQPYEMPVPVEDFMVFKKSHDNKGFILEKNTEMLNLHYPNIYTVDDVNLSKDDVYDFYYFYHNANDLKYTVIFDFYFTFLSELFGEEPIEKIINDIYYERYALPEYDTDQIEKFKNIFNKIMEYKFFNHQYAESDFLHRYLPIYFNKDKEPIEYKDETLKDWIKVDPMVLRNYVLEQNKLGASYHLFTNTIDLPSRLRWSTEEEIGTPTRIFDEARYVFAFNNEKDYPILLNCRVFVDGIMVGDIYQERRLFMDYFYIPADMVTDDSYIEMEIFPEYEFKKEITFNSLDDVKDITLVEPSDVIFPTMSDVYLETPGKTARYDKQYFDVTAKYSRGNFEVKTTNKKKPVKFTRLSKFTIKPNDECVLNKPLNFTITKMPRNVRFMIQHEGYLYIKLIEKGFSYNTEYLRIFRNGRLMPRAKYRLLTTFDYPRILFLDWFEPGDIIYIDITPYRYREIYYKEEIDKGETLIDLRSIINKPFDIRYYDVYINGRKLSFNNVFSITPWQMTLVNLRSNYNLLIYERERDWEYFGLDYKENIYYYTLDDLFKSGVVSEDIKNKMVKDIIDAQKDPRLNIYPNTNDEEKMNFDGDDLIYAIFYVFYFEELLPKTYLNPDVKQESEEVMLDNYIEVYDNYIRSAADDAINEADKERKKDYPQVLCLDPDIHCGVTDPPGPYLIYPVGHLTDVEQEYLDQQVVIPKEGNIDKKF